MAITPNICEHLKSIGTILEANHMRTVEKLSKIAKPIELIDNKGQRRVGVACNAPRVFTNELGHLLAAQAKSFCVVYYYDGSKGLWNYSVRATQGVNTLPIAQKYGGNGHPGASGFTLDYLLTELQ